MGCSNLGCAVAIRPINQANGIVKVMLRLAQLSRRRADPPHGPATRTQRL
jgi:hypothetical protein